MKVILFCLDYKKYEGLIITYIKNSTQTRFYLLYIAIYKHLSHFCTEQTSL